MFHLVSHRSLGCIASYPKFSKKVVKAVLGNYLLDSFSFAITEFDETVKVTFLGGMQVLHVSVTDVFIAGLFRWATPSWR